jgi:hypothetical protein
LKVKFNINSLRNLGQQIKTEKNIFSINGDAEMLKKAALVSLICLSLLLTTFAALSQAQTVSVGVSKGDKFTYLYAIEGNRTDRYPWLAWMPDQNQSRWDITVTGVTGSNITYQRQVTLSNGTTYPLTTETVDVNTGSSSTDNLMIFVNANLNVGDSIYPNGFALQIESETAKNYENEQRQAMNFSFRTTAESFKAFSDRDTGVLIQLTDTYYDNSSSVTITLVYSNVWAVQAGLPTNFPTAAPSPSIPEIPTTIVASALMAGLLAGLAVYKTKQKRIKKEN